jgi:hypothetical protein
MRFVLKLATRACDAAYLLATALGASVILHVATADAADSTINRPNDRAPYHVELEPHLVLDFIAPPGDGTGPGLGAGFRASFEIVHDGFVHNNNDSVAIGVGVDFAHYYGSGVVTPGTCTQFEPGPAGTNVCVRVAQTGGASNYAYFPVVMQWNFFLTHRWSVFGEPGLGLYWFDYGSVGVTPVFNFGGRFHFNDRVALTLRLGYPTSLSIGVSFLL